jgi:hypothetical protein
MKVLVSVPLVLLALLGAGGMSSLVDDDFCSMHYRSVPGTEGVVFGTELTLRPPGWRCTDLGRPTEITTGSWAWFFIALAGEALVAAWYLRRGSRSARAAFASTVTLAVAGASALFGGFVPALYWGFLVGTPLAWLVGGRDLTAALAPSAALFVAVSFALWYGRGSAVLGCFIAVALVTATAAAARAARPRPAR